MTTQAVATVLGGFWPTNGVNSLSGLSGESPWRRRAAQGFDTHGLLALREIMRALNGVAPGGTASKTKARVAASVELGGARAIENQSLVNRVTTTADRDEITADLLTLTTRTTFGASPPANLDRNPLGTR
jgi:hypothetical protein